MVTTNLSALGSYTWFPSADSTHALRVEPDYATQLRKAGPEVISTGGVWLVRSAPRTPDQVSDQRFPCGLYVLWLGSR